MREPAIRSRPAREKLPAGGLELLHLLARLLRRPRRGDRRLPLLWLVRPAGDGAAGALLRRFVGQGTRRRVPHAVLDLTARPPGRRRRPPRTRRRRGGAARAAPAALRGGLRGGPAAVPALPAG
ncbi:hypothetical protein [Micromonospora fulviviridis]|uniref:Uncharacterized protein n=1 Tax=Micromonospora fulviviridis TaxID=47860 RepID=A0ABV2VT53_9ACTN